MAGQSPGLIRMVRAIDKFTDTTGVWVAWLNLPLVFVVAWEVIARYAFNAPTIWSFDLTYMLYGTIFMLGAAYALHKGAHIRTDFFYERWSDRTRGIVDSISYLVSAVIGGQCNLHGNPLSNRCSRTTWILEAVCW